MMNEQSIPTDSPKLYMLLLGCKPAGRLTEQHDIFFGVAPNLEGLIPEILLAWPEANGKIHIDAWRKVTSVNGYIVSIQERRMRSMSTQPLPRLFFINLGGYKPGELEEFHYKIVVAAEDTAAAIRKAKATAFFKHMSFKGAASHIDDKYGIDVDDIFAVEDILPAEAKERFQIMLTPAEDDEADKIHPGYFTLQQLKKLS